MNQTNKTLTMRRRMAAATAAFLAAGLAAFAASAATSQTVGTGTMEYSKAVGGPATVFMRTLTIAPGEVLGWHHHPGIGAYTIVVSGALNIEDGCGGERVYSQGDAFLESPDRVHRGKNLTNADVVTAQTFVVPLGMPTTVMHAQRMCGVPQSVRECLRDGWRAFDYPRYFINQGDCVKFVLGRALPAK
jgi:quercetin dioxygenase-like cupin family protein